MSKPTAIAHPHLLLVTTILASSLAFIDGSVVNVGLPALGRAFGTSSGGLPWVLNAYALPLSALLLIGGAAGDVFGVRRLLIAGLSLFAVASAGCAASPTIEVLIACRAVQGIAAALLMPNSLAILGVYFAGEARGRAIGIWAAAGAATTAVGPVLGGYLIDLTGWRAIFLINLPIVVVAITLALRAVPQDTRAGSRRLDWVGALLVAASLTALTWGLTAISSAHPFDAAVAVALLVGVLGLASFIRFEQAKGERAMLPLSLFRSRHFVALTVLTLLLYGALSALMMLIPFVLIENKQYSATAAGAVLLPLPIAIAVGSSWIGRVAERLGPRLPLTVGSLLAGVGCALALRVPALGNYWITAFPAILVLSIGMAAAVAPLTTAVLNSVEDEHNGVASGFNSATARIGGLVAVAFSSTVLAAHGSTLSTSFRVAVVVAAGAAALAALSAFVGLRAAPSKP